MNSENVDPNDVSVDEAISKLLDKLLDVLRVAADASLVQPQGQLLDALSMAVANLTRLCVKQADNVSRFTMAERSGNEVISALAKHAALLKSVVEAAQHITEEVRQRAVSLSTTEIEELYSPNRNEGSAR